MYRFGYDAQNNLSDIWDANNNRTQIQYDNLLRITKRTNALNEETIYTYSLDRLQQIEIGRTASNGEGQIIKYNYDSFNRVQSIQRKDDAGQFLTLFSYTKDSEGRILTETDGENNIWRNTYDIAGNLKSRIDPKSNTTTYSYDASGRVVSIIDANLNQIKYTYDDLGRKIQIEQLGVTPSIITKFTYDAVNNLTSVMDGENNTTTYAYDALSRKTSETKSLGQTIQYFYDNRDRMDYMINARGQKIGNRPANTIFPSLN